MAPRAYWKGYLKLSLVSCPIALYPATSEREKITFHQLNKTTGNRIKYRKVDAESGDEVEAADIIKGYEVGKGEYLELAPEELEAIAIESKRVIEIDEFVPRKEIDEVYFNSPYYVVPDGEIGQQAFAVIREAVRKEGMVALGKIAFTSREHIIALEPRNKGLLGVTLRYPYEVRKQADFFDDIEDEQVPKDMLELATHIVKTKAGHFDPAKFSDQYENALKELLERKQSGTKIEHAKEREPAKVINLMDALRRSVQSERQPTAQPKQSPAQPKKGRKRIEGQREMLLPIEGKQSSREPARKAKTNRAAGAVETRPAAKKRSSR
jgi:DNA end-binding protein Ku